MALQTLTNQEWRRKHDPREVIQAEGITVHCADDPASFIGLCANRPADVRFKAAGRHWSLSTSTVSDNEWLETQWPGTQNVPRNSGFATPDMLQLISSEAFDFLITHPPQRPDDLMSDPCLTDGIESLFFVHLKSGTRVFEAYSLLDRSPGVITDLAAELNSHLDGGPAAHAYDGPWGFRTLGGAGGQTVFGALTTGTHGGDYRQQPISDSVLALHLVTDGGAHFWIEPEHPRFEVRLSDDDRLREHYGELVPGIPFEIIRDDDIFNSVTVGVGRFGVVTSVVLRVVPQYCLHEHRRLDQWSRVKAGLMSGAVHHVFDPVHFAGSPAEVAADQTAFSQRFGPPAAFLNRFLQIGVSLPPDGGNDHLCGITQRWFYPPSGPEARDPSGELRGRNERGTAAVAGMAGAYEPPDDPSKAGGNTSFISAACGSGNFVAGLLRQAAEELEEIVRDGVVPAAGIAVAALGIGAGTVVLAIAGLCAALAAAALLLKEIADAIEASGDTSLADVVDDAVGTILSSPLPREVAIMLIRAIFNLLFRSQQSNRDYVALSYAVMDGHDYLDRSCFSNAESIEVFFDAARPDLYCAYVDAILSFEAFQQEQRGQFSIGYVSLRYVLGSDALIAPARFAETVVIEVAALRDAAGSVDFVMNAARVARSPIFNATFHWGQFNPVGRQEVEQQFGVRLDRWRAALAQLTDNGARDGFSSEFTRRTGLEPF
jgi:hypothetical protein